MRSATLRNSSGPGSSIILTPETIKVRDKVIERFIDKPLSELTAFLHQTLDDEINEERRLGLIAARIYILRHRVDHIKAYNRDKTIEPMPQPTPRSMLAPPPAEQPDAEQAPSDDTSPENTRQLSEVLTIEAGEINGVRIPAGITITVNTEDAERLVANGKAELVHTQNDDTLQTEQNMPAAETELSEETITQAAADIGDPGASASAMPAEDSAEDSAEEDAGENTGQNTVENEGAELNSDDATEPQATEQGAEK